MAKFCRFCGRKLRTGSERFCRAVAQICLAEITRPPRIMEMDGATIR